MTDDTQTERDRLVAQLRAEVARVKKARESFDLLPAHPRARALLDIDRKLAAAERSLLQFDSTAMAHWLEVLKGVHDYAVPLT